jgi:flagellar M-ring protein FliF
VRASSEPALAEPVGAPQIAEIIQAKPSQTSKMIEIAQVQGQVHAQSVQKVGELADRNPNESAAIVRHWLHEVA